MTEAPPPPKGPWRPWQKFMLGYVCTLAVVVCCFQAAAGEQQFGGTGFDGSGSITGDGTGTATGFLHEIEANTATSGAPNVLEALESGKLLTNDGVGAAVNYHTLPSAVAGLEFSFHLEDSTGGAGLRVTAASGDTIEIGGLETASAGYVESTSRDSGITLTAVNADEWATTTMPAGSRSAWNIDGVASGFGAHGSYWVSTPAATDAMVDTPLKAAGTTTSGPIQDWTQSGTNRMTYNGLKALDFTISITVGMSREGGGGKLLGSILLAEGGTPIPGARVDRQMSDSTDEGAFPLTFVVTASTNSFYEIWVASSLEKELTIESGGMTIWQTSSD